MSDPTVLQQEIAAEQRHLDRVYARLAELRTDAVPGREGGLSARRGRHTSARWSNGTRWSSTPPGAGTPWTPSTRAWSSAGWTWPTRAVHYVGRMGIRDENAEPLVVDWRAPAAAAFYRATAGRPAGRGPAADDPVGRRAGHRHRGRPARPGGGAGRHAGGRRRRAAGQPVQGHRPRHAGHRRDHPARAGRGDPLPRLRRDDRDRRAGHRQDRGGPAPGGVPAVFRPQPVRRRRHPGGRPVRGVRRVHRHGAAVAGRGHRDAAVARHAGAGLRREPGRPDRRSPRSRARCGCAGCWSGPRTTRCRAPRPSCGCSTAARCCGWAPAELDRIRRRALPRGARRNEVRGRASTASSTRSGRRPAAATVDQPAGEARLRGRDRRPRRVPGLPAGLVAAVHADAGAALAGPAGAAAGVRQRGAVPRGDRAAAGVVRPARADGPTIADVALLDELDELLGRPRQPAKKSKRPVPRPRRRPGGQHVRRPAGGRPGAAGAARRTTTATTRTWWWTRRRTCRRCSGG